MPYPKLIRQSQIPYILLIHLLFLGSVETFSQDYFFDNYSIGQGLNDQKIYVILQDTKGFIWLGTKTGLSRFDGMEFLNFTTLDSVSPGGVRSAFQDSLGHIWFGHLNGGITRFNGTRFEKIGFDSLRLNGDITAISQKGNKMWITTRSEGALMFNLPVNNVRHVRARQYMGRKGLSDRVNGLADYHGKGLICIADIGLKRYDDKSDRFTSTGTPENLPGFDVTCLIEDSRKDTWIGTFGGGIYKYRAGEAKNTVVDLVQNGFSDNLITCLAEDNKGRIWAGTAMGEIAVIDGNNVRKFDRTNGLNTSLIYCIFRDREGNMLIADEKNGLTIFKGEDFRTLSDYAILHDPNVNALIQDINGALWFGTNEGLTRFFENAAGVTRVFSGKINPFFRNIVSIRADGNKNLWILSRSGLIKYNVAASSFEPQPYINSVLQDKQPLKAFEIDRLDNLWIGTADGVVTGTSGKENFRTISFEEYGMGTISSIYCDPAGDIWLGTEPKSPSPSLFKYHPIREKPISSADELTKIPCIRDVKVISMVMDAKGELWAGTDDGLRAFRNDSSIITLSTKDGLLSNLVNLVAEGKDGCIYIGTNKGLNRYLPDRKLMISYTGRNGFAGIEAKPGAVYLASGGELWFGTANGATKFIPPDLPDIIPDPKILINNIYVNGKIRDITPVMKLKHSENSVTVSYSSIYITNPDIVKYKIRLSGSEDSIVTSETRISYPGLAPGRYVFTVSACNEYGIWNRIPATVSFTILPPFYKTWWFFMLSVLVSAGSILITAGIREKKLVRANLVLEEKVKERTSEVVHKSAIIEEKNRDITASIRYAERIQQAMLPPENTFRDTFILFIPKDIVSGDFYWMYENGELQFIAAVDCTGHGVPGAFMSMIGHTLLNKIVIENGLVKPAEILDMLNKEVTKALMQRTEKAVNDGMDLALICFDRKSFILGYSGAYNPLYVVRNGEVIIYKGDRFSIGISSAGTGRRFSNHELEVQPGDMLYIFSDGYADQFGSPESVKFKSSNVRKLLSEIWNLPPERQKEILEKAFYDWKGDLEQVDDVLFIGTRIPEK